MTLTPTTMYIKILPTQGYTATERAAAISAELFSISRPQSVRQSEDVSNYLFGWVTHPTIDEAVLISPTNYVIKVHPQNNLTALMALFPSLTEVEKSGLAEYIQSSQSFPLYHILPSNTEYYTQEEYDLIFSGNPN